MAIIREDIDINIEAKYQSLVGLINQLEKAKSSFKNLGGAKIDKGLREMIKRAADPIQEAAKQLEIAQKGVEKAESKLRSARVSGAVDTSAQETMLNEAKLREKVVIKTIEHTKRLADVESQITQQHNEQQTTLQGVLKARQALQNVMASLNPVSAKMSQLRNQMGELQQKFIDLNVAGKNTKATELAIQKVYKQMQKLEQATTRTSNRLAVLWGRIKNIAIYRTIRSLIKSVTSGFREGLNNFVQYSDSANKTVSNLNASLNQIRNTMGVALAQVLIALEPVIVRIADALVDFINAFDLAMAKMRGEDFYLKAKKNVDNYAKSLEKANQLSFDSFEVLSKSNKTAVSEMFEKGSVLGDENALSETFGLVLELSKSLVNILDTLGGIKTVVIALIALGIKKMIDGLIGSFSSIKAGIIGAKTKLEEWNLQCALAKSKSEILQMSWKSLAAAAISAGVAILSIVKNWNNMSQQTKGWVKAIASVTAAVAGLAFVVLALKGQWAKAVTIAGGVITAGSTVLTVVSGFEKGGIPEKSELFYMNEHGNPEALVNTGGSQTNVINIDQLSEGMRRGFVQAIYDTGLIDSVQTRIVVDGNSVNDNAFARAIFPALKTESKRRGGNQL